LYSWGHDRRFNSYSEYFRKQFNGRVQKLSIDAGLTCPNRDGTVAKGGCTYCLNDAFNPSYCHPKKSIRQQILEGIEFHRKRYRRAEKFLAYFQAYSNTYAPLDHLIGLYEEALSVEGVIGLVIGTRPDCIDEEKLAWFRDLSRDHYLVLEYGLESCYNRTLERINRGHTFEQSVEALKMTDRYGINTGAHIIFGLPGESEQDMLNQAKTLSALPLKSIKFHQLQLIKNTKIAEEFEKNPVDFHRFSLDGYLDFIVRFVERLNPGIIIERFAGEVPPRFLVRNDWGKIRNDQILHRIEKLMKEKDTWQGKYFH
jgi:radical SAM protein (TIGR01212 family)